jgi:hypothetical protein
VGAGLVVTLVGRLPFKIGRLPGDVVIRSRHGTFYFPVATSILLSIIATIVLSLFRRRG